MSISSVNKQKKMREAAYSKMIGGYKDRIDNGEKLEDLDFRGFGEKADELYLFLKEYVKANKTDGGIQF